MSVITAPPKVIVVMMGYGLTETQARRFIKRVAKLKPEARRKAYRTLLAKSRRAAR